MSAMVADGPAFVAAAVRAACMAHAPRRTVMGVAAAVAGVFAHPATTRAKPRDVAAEQACARAEHADSEAPPEELLTALRSARRSQRQRKKQRRRARQLTCARRPQGCARPARVLCSVQVTRCSFQETGGTMRALSQSASVSASGGTPLRRPFTSTTRLDQSASVTM